VSEISVLKGIFGPKRKEVMGGWRELHDELHKLFSFPNMIRTIE
jgi:hypothetical protein